MLQYGIPTGVNAQSRSEFSILRQRLFHKNAPQHRYQHALRGELNPPSCAVGNLQVFLSKLSHEGSSCNSLIECSNPECESVSLAQLHGSRFIMENGAKGVEVIISGKLRAQRAKAPHQHVPFPR